MQEVFVGSNRKGYVLSLINDEIAHKEGNSKTHSNSKKHKNNFNTISKNTIKRDPVQHKRKLNAASRIIDNKQKELSRK